MIYCTRCILVLTLSLFFLTVNGSQATDGEAKQADPEATWDDTTIEQDELNLEKRGDWLLTNISAIIEALGKRTANSCSRPASRKFIEVAFQPGEMMGITYTQSDGGHRIDSVDRYSQAERLGVCEGWTIVEVNGKDVLKATRKIGEDESFDGSDSSDSRKETYADWKLCCAQEKKSVFHVTFRIPYSGLLSKGKKLVETLRSEFQKNNTDRAKRIETLRKKTRMQKMLLGFIREAEQMGISSAADGVYGFINNLYDASHKLQYEHGGEWSRFLGGEWARKFIGED